MDSKKINARFDKIENLIHSLSESLTTRYKELDDKITEVISSQTFLNTKFEEFVERLSKVEVANNDLVKENTSLKTQVLGSANEINSLKEAMNNLEQYSRRDCLEIKGIPEKESESVEETNDIVQSLGDKIGVTIQEYDISISHRLPSRRSSSLYTGSPTPIIVKFTNRIVRDKFYRARRLLKNITSENLGYNTSNKIFINESLTQRNKDLFYKCLQVKKAKGLKFLWTNVGKIYMKKDDHSSVMHIASIKDLKVFES